MPGLGTRIFILISSLAIVFALLNLKSARNFDYLRFELPVETATTTPGTTKEGPIVEATSSAPSAALEKPKTQAAKTAPLPETKNAAQVQKELIPLETLNQKVRPAMVNVFCTTKSGGDFRPVSGSGVIIDPRGVILTNAHVAQYFLIKNYLVKDYTSCIGRAGSPASPAYKLDLLYFPADWLSQNPGTMKMESPEGTGENDYALLLITGPAENTPLPAAFPFVEADTDQRNILPGSPMLLIGYPAGFLGGIETNRELWLTASPSNVTRFYYFIEEGNLDAFSLGSNIIAQKGSSGGAAINQLSGHLQGILTTTSGGETTGERDLDAISLAHIERSFQKSTGKTLREFLSGDLNQSLLEFKEKTLPGLVKTITAELDK